MNEERRSYPCDEPEKKAYPCDEPEKKSYPCDEPEKKSYPCDEPESKRDRSLPEEGQEAEKRPVGKGRRGGNAAASIVVHSGKPSRFAKSAPEAGKDGRGPQRDRKDRPDRLDRRSGADRPDRADRRSGADRPDRAHRPAGTDRPARAQKAPRRSSEENADFEAMKELPVTRTTEIGAFLDYEGTSVLLPFSEQTVRPKEGDTVKVRLYGDKGGRLTATMREPYLKAGEVGILKVADVGKIGAFLDNGMPKQVLLPFREQVVSPKTGDEVLVFLYGDKSGRIAATMRVYRHLESRSPYQKDDTVKGFVYEISEKLGVFVAVDDKYFGLIPSQEVYGSYRYGDRIEARVVRVREDGKLDLAVREKSYLSLDADAEAILAELDKNGGKLGYADRADAAFIEETYRMSKNQFKRALGHLYRQHLVEIDRENGTVTRIS